MSNYVYSYKINWENKFKELDKKTTVTFNNQNHISNFDIKNKENILSSLKNHKESLYYGILFIFIFCFLFFLTISLSFAATKNTAENKIENLTSTAAEDLLRESLLNENGNIDESIQNNKIQTYDFNKIQFSKYRVKNNETIAFIAKKTGLRIDTIVLTNNIKENKRLKSGIFLNIPNQDGRVVIVEKNDSVYKLSERYGISWKSISDVNNLNSENLEPGTKLFIPGSRMTKTEKQRFENTNPINNNLYQWPLRGKISSYFGQRIDPFTGAFSYHTGIDIKNDLGNPVKVINSGIVIDTNYNDIYGNYIIIKHSNGITSKYCHLSKILVQKYDNIIKDKIIAEVGSTGRSTGAHLHLEIRKYGKLIDPIKFLK